MSASEPRKTGPKKRVQAKVDHSAYAPMRTFDLPVMGACAGGTSTCRDLSSEGGTDR